MRSLDSRDICSFVIHLSFFFINLACEMTLVPLSLSSFSLSPASRGRRRAVARTPPDAVSQPQTHGRSPTPSRAAADAPPPADAVSRRGAGALRSCPLRSRPPVRGPRRTPSAPPPSPISRRPRYPASPTTRRPASATAAPSSSCCPGSVLSVNTGTEPNLPIPNFLGTKFL